MWRVTEKLSYKRYKMLINLRHNKLEQNNLKYKRINYN